MKKDGCVGCPVKPGERTVTLMRHSRRIDIQPNPENRTVWRKVGRILEHLFKGKFIVPSKSHTIREPRSGLGDLVAPPGFARRSTDNDGDGRCLRQDVQDIFKENRIVVRDRHDSIVLGQFIEVHAASLYQSVQHGRRWKRSLRWACTKLAAGAPMAMIRSGDWSILRVRRYSTNGASDLSLLRRAFNSE